MTTPRLLIVDDEEDVADFMANVGRLCGFDVNVAPDKRSFADLCRSFKPSVITLDLQMPDADGIECLRELA